VVSVSLCVVRCMRVYVMSRLMLCYVWISFCFSFRFSICVLTRAAAAGADEVNRSVPRMPQYHSVPSHRHNSLIQSVSSVSRLCCSLLTTQLTSVARCLSLFSPLFFSLNTGLCRTMKRSDAGLYAFSFECTAIRIRFSECNRFVSSHPSDGCWSPPHLLTPLCHAADWSFTRFQPVTKAPLMVQTKNPNKP